MSDTPSAESSASHKSHSELLDSIYRLQRHIYDLTRKYFLFGRDTLIRKLTQGTPSTVLEVGCGTGRNLRVLQKSLPQGHLFGLDASREMLQQAEKKLPNTEPRIRLAYGFAESFSGNELFEQSHFDRVVFSYSLSMIPDWKGSLENGLAHLAPDGAIWIVDFWDQAGYPKLFQRLLIKWLDLFHVRFEPALLEYLENLESEGRCTVKIEPIGRRYAYIAEVRPKA